ncbi:MAG: hypothetical protein LPJ87_07935 [Zoogloeaceae bacterium]|nr:hypothetical protein [Zoogloeaceae bacterium]
MASTWLPRVFLFLVLAVPAAVLANKGSIFCCQAASGQSICGDVVPHACYGREYREISPRGTVLRVYAAPLSAEEQASLEARKRRIAQEEAEREQKRRLDTALMQTYREAGDIDRREAESLVDIDTVINDIRKRLGELDEERLRLEEEFAGLPADQITVRQRGARADLDNERATYQRLLQSKLDERKAVQERFAVDRKRYLELSAEGVRR